MFTLAISCLTNSNLPWFMDLTFQVPMQYCSSQHRTLLLSRVTSTTGYCFCFSSMPSFFLEIFLYWSPVAYWALINLGVPLSVFYHFAFFILFMGFSRQEYWSGLPFPSPVDHSQTSPPWHVCLGWPHTAWLSFTELDKAAVRLIRLSNFLCRPPRSVPAVTDHTEAWRRGATPRLRSGAVAQERLRGATPRPRSGAAA